MVGIIDCNAGNSTAGLCNTVQGSVSLASGVVEYSDYGYIVASWSAYFFTVAFGLATLLHIFVGALKRQWWVLFTLALGAAIETIGWAGRIMSVTGYKWNENLGGYWEYDHNSFIIQIVCLVIAPTLFSAANYVILGKLINATGGTYSLLTPRSFAIWFMFSDFVCLVVQGAGGGIAGTAATHEDADNGALIMTGGVVVQLAVTVAFLVVLGDFIRRYRSGRPARRQFHPLPNIGFMRRRSASQEAVSSDVPLQQYPTDEAAPQGKFGSGHGSTATSTNAMAPLEHEMSRRGVWIVVTMLIFSSILIVVRSVYRSVELTDGWTGPIAIDQGLFLGLDAFLMFVLVWAYLVVHPAFFLPRQKL